MNRHDSEFSDPHKEDPHSKAKAKPQMQPKGTKPVSKPMAKP